MQYCYYLEYTPDYYSLDRVWARVSVVLIPLWPQHGCGFTDQWQNYHPCRKKKPSRSMLRLLQFIVELLLRLLKLLKLVDIPDEVSLFQCPHFEEQMQGRIESRKITNLRQTSCIQVSKENSAQHCINVQNQEKQRNNDHHVGSYIKECADQFLQCF
jgi:hypothetical protein